MCGICGQVNLSDQAQPVSRSNLETMAQAMFHRGPDGKGFYLNSDGSVGFGFRRLSIIDLSTGDQPISNEDGSIWVVFNGEIYNFQEIRQSLEKMGHIFRSNTDTEVIVHAYEQYGEDCLGHFRGMFAFALWDQRQRRLLLARDRVGKKPLFYYCDSNVLVFGSELKALLRHSEVPIEIDPTGLDLYLTYGYIPAPWTILRKVKKLPPAHYLIIDVGSHRTKIENYWEPNYLPKLKLSQQDAGEEFLEILRDSVRLRMISDVPIGALLSGGIDSSLIVALMAEFSSQPINTFTIGIEESKYDERPYARIVAQDYGTNHHEYVVHPDLGEILPKLAWYLDEPIADSSAIPSYYVAQMARQHVTVVLNGDGGDENFGGYRHYRSVINAEMFAHLPKVIRNGVIRPVTSYLQKKTGRSLFQRINNLTEQAPWPIWAKHEQRMLLFPESDRLQLLSREFPISEKRNNYFEDVYMGAQGYTTLDSMLRADLLTGLPGDLLVKMDRMTMAHSLEARSPLLDHKLVEFAAKLPSHFKVGMRERKILLRQVAANFLPPDLIKRKKKGFSVPIADWLYRDLGDRIFEILLDRDSQIGAILNPEAVNSILCSPVVNNKTKGAQVWGLLVLEFWLSEVLGKSIAEKGKTLIDR